MIDRIVKPLTKWYHENRRILPWREEKNPYYIWISEIMLQQTRVEAVKPYFQRFIRALPDPAALAACPEDQLLKLWEGLGYYNRVRNMQKAAVRIMEEYGGKLPADYEALKGLPGIGSYTAGAVASIAYGIPVPAVDGNVLRVVARITEDYSDIMKQSVKSRVERELLEIIPQEDPGTFNQAMMELGATVCVPNGPARCGQCPAAPECLARKHGTVEILPVKKKARARKIEKKTVLLIRDGEKVALHRRPSSGLLAGMYELPNLEGHLSQEEVLSRLSEYGLTALRILPLGPSRHVFSHVEWMMEGYDIRVAALDDPMDRDLLFVDVRDAEEKYAVPAAFGAYASKISMRLGQEKYDQMGSGEG
ncbi:MAG TPA: A/G-specific adenine glycosylase [Candidatus Pullilachnospira intestinigallinarum]|nr:A/G-specific adenine glycosylase [Candidatus Pullilachnospira intestinigallinarum]